MGFDRVNSAPMADDPATFDIVFLAVGYNARYENLLPTYAAMVLETVPDSAVEMVVLDAAAFKARLGAALAVLGEAYPGRATVREQSFPRRVIPNSVRFYEVPTLHGSYTYIGDVDIFITDPLVTQTHAAIMAETGLPYSNKVRGSGKKLSGLHCVKTDTYYTPALKAKQAELLAARDPKTLDEAILLELCRDVHGLTPNTKRPVHGLHVSYRRKVNDMRVREFQRFVRVVGLHGPLKAMAGACGVTAGVLHRVADEMQKYLDDGAGANPRVNVRAIQRDMAALRGIGADPSTKL